MSLRCDVVCGEGVREGTMALALLSAGFHSFPPLPTSKVGPSGADSCGWVCVRSWTLWVSPTNSPVRLGVSPTATSTPKGFSISGLTLYFPTMEPWGCMVCFVPPLFLPVYLHANVGPQGPPSAPCWSAAAWTALLHNQPPRWVCQPPFCRKSSLPSCPSLPLLLVWMNVSSLTLWLSDFHKVWFSVSLVVFCF